MKLTLMKSKGFAEKLNNSENLKMAEMICTRRRNEVNKNLSIRLLSWSSCGRSTQGKVTRFARVPSAILKTLPMVRLTSGDITLVLVDDHHDYLLTLKSRYQKGYFKAKNTVTYF